MNSNRKNILSLFVFMGLWVLVGYAAEAPTWRVYLEEKPALQIPDILGYKTLVCDFHMHTVFSDGSVWPTVRVDEARREGVDVIAITDHVEYRPHKNDIPSNLNRSYEIAEEYAKSRNILLLHGAEITPDTPPGHFNAIFTEDNNKLDIKDETAKSDVWDVTAQIRAANEQKAFVFWNHPGWQGLERGQWGAFHTHIFDHKWLHGIEICNGEDYYDYAHQIANERNLTVVGNTDIHDPSLNTKSTARNHRTVTLVFAKEKSVSAVKEALQAGRTAVWCKNRLFGKQEYLEALLSASIQITPPYQKGKNKEKNVYWVELKNKSDFDLELSRSEKADASKILLAAQSTVLVRVQADPESREAVLSGFIQNFLNAPNQPLPVKFTVPLE